MVTLLEGVGNRVALSDGEKQAAYRSRKRWFEAGYARREGPKGGSKEEIAAWCEGVWLSHAEERAGHRLEKRAAYFAGLKTDE